MRLKPRNDYLIVDILFIIGLLALAIFNLRGIYG